MGRYATTTALQIIMVGQTFDTATTYLATKCIDDAEAEINKFISGRYDVASFQTSTSVPPLITSLAERYAEGGLWMRQARGRKEPYAMGASIKKDVLDELDRLRTYKISLVDIDGTLVGERTDGKRQILSNTDTYVDTFAEDNPLSWSVDNNKLEDIADDRDT